MSNGSARPWLLLLAFFALLAAPAPWLVPALGIAALALTGLRTVRALAALLARSTAPADGTIGLGRDRAGRSVAIEPGELSAHGLILGASGSGKTTTLLRILTEQIQAGQPVIAIDMKGSPAFVRSLQDACAASRRQVKVWTMEGGASWNPLQYGNPTELKDKLIATERFSEPHYQRAAERYLQIVLRVLAEADPHRPATLEEVVQTMDPRRLPRLLRELSPERAAPVRDYLDGLTSDQQSAIRGVQTRIALITESQAGPFLSPPAAPSTDAIDLREALSGREVVVFSLNSSTYGKLASQLGTLVVQDLVSALGRQLAEGRPRHGAPATIALDEFSGLGGDHVVALFARVREAGGGVLVATQELADLDRAATGLRDQVVGNTAFKIIHRQDVPASARLAAQMAGTERVWEETQALGGWWQPARGGNRRQVERFILDPNEIATLRTGEAAMISKLRGARPQVVRVSPSARPAPARPRRAGRQEGRALE